MTQLNQGQPGTQQPTRARVRNLALALTSLALAFYFGFIALTFYRSHHYGHRTIRENERIAA